MFPCKRRCARSRPLEPELTEMEVVVLRISDREDQEDGVDDGWGMLAGSTGNRTRVYRRGIGWDVRVAVEFLPKCFAWYRPRRPVALTSGAAPRGSFS